jgi:RNA-binding protein 4
MYSINGMDNIYFIRTFYTFSFVHIDADACKNKVNEILRELNGYNLNGSQIRVQQSTSGVRQKPGMGGDQCYR